MSLILQYPNKKLPTSVKILSLSLHLHHTFNPRTSSTPISIKELCELSHKPYIDAVNAFFTEDTGAFYIDKEKQIPARGWINLRMFDKAVTVEEANIRYTAEYCEPHKQESDGLFHCHFQLGDIDADRVITVSYLYDPHQKICGAIDENAPDACPNRNSCIWHWMRKNDDKPIPKNIYKVKYAYGYDI